ncbi:unnamed protein product [Paramecium sonneborni]|uniref:Uncharacterized protein n=1 Tax=Paramecium sonneborni TaxID=65129 RepID=A0A8S1QMA9_9CILI|nr:unnamed protein product [Paramecium sonneborni]
MYQKSGKMEHMYNNQGYQQKQSNRQNVNSQQNIQNASYDSAIKQTNREFFMQGGTNQTIKDHQKHKIFDNQNQFQLIKNPQFISRFPSDIPNSPQFDRSNIKTCDIVNKYEVKNLNNKPQMIQNNYNNANYYQNQGKIVKTEQQYSNIINCSNRFEQSNKHSIFQKNETQSMDQKQNYNTIQEQNNYPEQMQQYKITTKLYDQLVQQKGNFQEVQIKNSFEDEYKPNNDSIKYQNVEQSIIKSEIKEMNLSKRESQTIKIFERNLGTSKIETIKESPIKQTIQVEIIKSESINPIIQLNQIEQQAVDQLEIKNQENLKCDQLNEQIEIMKFDDEDTNMEEPVKVSNFVTTKIQLKGEKQLQQFNQISQPSQRCSALQFEVLEKMNQVRHNRLDGMKIEFFGAVERLERSDCITDLVADKQIIQLIITQFPYLRRVRGDGNCLFSSLLFPYLELIHVNNLFDNVLNQFVAHEIYWNNSTIIDRPMVFTLIKKIFQELKKLSKKCNNDMMMFSEVILHYMNQVNGFYDILIIFMRSTIIQSYKLYCQQGEYQYFLDEKTSEEFLERNSSFEEEGDFLSIQFFSEITQFKVKLINFSDKHPIQSMQTLEPKLNKPRNDQNNFITLKYNEGHYDILYSRMLKQMQIKEEKRQLPQISFTALY